MSTSRDERWIQLLALENERLRAELDAARIKIENLTAALESNREIGAALGVLMVTRKITLDAAFDLMRESSQESQRKLRDVAADVLYTGALAPPPGRAPDPR